MNPDELVEAIQILQMVLFLQVMGKFKIPFFSSGAA